MASTQREQLIRLVPRAELAQDIRDFLIDRQARGLSSRTVQFYSDELRYLRNFLQSMNIHDTSSATPTHLRQYLLHLGSTRNPGGCLC